MSLWARIQEDMKTALKEKRRDELGVLRMVVSSVKYAGIDNQGQVTDDLIIKVLRKETKKRREAIEAYEKGGRKELAEKEKAELDILKRYLPQMMSEEEVKRVVTEIVEVGGEKRSFGEVMGEVMKKLKGRAEGGMVARVVREMMDKVQ